MARSDKVETTDLFSSLFLERNIDSALTFGVSGVDFWRVGELKDDCLLHK